MELAPNLHYSGGS